MTDPRGKVVGHKTFHVEGGGFRHEHLYEDEAEAMLAACEAAETKRAEAMPTDRDAVNALWDAWYRLKELGWKDARHVLGTGDFDVIELGSTGIHRKSYVSSPAVLYRVRPTGPAQGDGEDR